MSSQSPSDTAVATVLIMIASYYTMRIISTDDFTVCFHKVLTLLKTLPILSKFRRSLRQLGLSELDVLTMYTQITFQVTTSTTTATEVVPTLCSKFLQFINQHPQCPITMEDILDETDHIKPNVDAVIGIDENQKVIVSCFNHFALERWTEDHDKHPLTRAPMSKYTIIQIS